MASTPTPVPIRWAIGGFIVACIALLLAGRMLAPKGVKGFPISERAAVTADGSFSVTLDARSAEDWVGFNFGLGRPGEGTPELLVRRSVLLAPAGGALDLGPVPLEDATLPEDPTWSQDEGMGDGLTNPGFGRWYSYSYWTHLLKTKHHTYAIRRAEGGVAFVQVTSFYCDPEGSGCLSIRYRLDDGRGT